MGLAIRGVSKEGEGGSGCMSHGLKPRVWSCLLVTNKSKFPRSPAVDS